jgi:hypothetical protein
MSYNSSILLHVCQKQDQELPAWLLLLLQVLCSRC